MSRVPLPQTIASNHKDAMDGDLQDQSGAALVQASENKGKA